MAPLPPLVPPAGELTRDEITRYSRHLVIPEVGTLGQRRLKNARVLVVGAGGLGSPVLLYLAAAGVGTLGIVDDDVVEASNLQRQVIHTTADVGSPKAHSARTSITAINPLVSVVVHGHRLDAGHAVELFSAYDLVVDGTDNFATRYLVNDAAVLAGTPYVWGSIHRFEGQASVFWEDAPDGRGINYRDVYPVPPPPGTVPSCAEGGVLGVLCSAIGSVMGTEVIKLIVGIGEPLLGRLMMYDALAMSHRTIRVRKDPAAERITRLIDYDAFCGVPAEGGAAAGDALVDSGSIDDGAVGATELKAMLDAGADVAIIDVREPGEWEIAHLPGATLVPAGLIEGGGAWAQLPRGRPIVLHCKSGARSARALAVLRAEGYEDARHLRGGLLAWAAEVDAAMPTY